MTKLVRFSINRSRAAWIVRSLPLDVVRWLVVAVVVYTGTTLLRAARAAEPAPLRQPAN